MRLATLGLLIPLARALGVTLPSVEVRGSDDFSDAFAAIASARPDS